MKAFAYLFFDLDGTLIDPHEGVIGGIRRSLCKLGVNPPENLDWCIGPPLKDSFDILLSGYPHIETHDAIALYREEYAVTGLYQNKLYDGITPMLTILHENNFKLYLATSKPWVYAEKILAHYQLDHLFTKIYGPELSGIRSDKTELLMHILKEEKIDPSKILMIGDRKFDLIAAKNNRISSIGVLWGYGTKEELQEHDPYYITETPIELLKFLS